MIRTMLDPRDLNGVSFFTTKNVPKNTYTTSVTACTMGHIETKMCKKIMPLYQAL